MNGSVRRFVGGVAAVALLASVLIVGSPDPASADPPVGELYYYMSIDDEDADRRTANALITLDQETWNEGDLVTYTATIVGQAAEKREHTYVGSFGPSTRCYIGGTYEISLRSSWPIVTSSPAPDDVDGGTLTWTSGAESFPHSGSCDEFPDPFGAGDSFSITVEAQRSSDGFGAYEVFGADSKIGVFEPREVPPGSNNPPYGTDVYYPIRTDWDPIAPVTTLTVERFDDLPLVVRLTPVTTDPDDTYRDVYYRFDLGDGTISNEWPVSHAYSEPGRYEVVVTTFDRDGNQHTLVETVSVGLTGLSGEALLTDTAELGPTVRADETRAMRVRVDNESDRSVYDVVAGDITVERISELDPGDDEPVPPTVTGPVDDGFALPLAADGPGSVDFADFTLETFDAGTFEVTIPVAGVDSTGDPVTGTITWELEVRGEPLRVELTAHEPGADDIRAPGERFELELDLNDHDDRVEIDVTVTNDADETITDLDFLDPNEPIQVDPLLVDESGSALPVAFDLVSDPLPDLADSTLDPGESTTVTYLFEATDATEVELEAVLTGVLDDTTVNGRATVEVAVTAGDPFTWEMTPRFEADESGRLPYSYDPADLDPDAFEVVATLRESLCERSLEFGADGAVLTPTSRDGCRVTFEMAEGTHGVTVSADGDPLGEVEIEVDDILIVVLGDSVASGEGNPGPFGFRGPVPECHRSQEAAAATAAATIEDENDQTSVTFLHLACSGASILDGLLTPQLLLLAETEVHQLELLDTLIDREIDAAIVQAGANDMGFGGVVMFCYTYEGCEQQSFGLRTNKQPSLNAWLPGAYQIPRLDAQLCDAIQPGATDMIVTFEPDVSSDFLMFDHRGWTATVNPGGWDYSDDRTSDSIGPAPDFEVDGPVTTSGALCGGLDHRADVPLDDEFDEHWPRFLAGQPQARGLSVQPQTPTVALTAPTLDDWVDIHLGDDEDGLEARFSRLGDAMEAFDIDEVFLVEYPDELTDSDGESCAAGQLVGTNLGIDEWEADWARDEFLQPLNREVRGAAADHVWNFVGGIEAGFRTHGYCADDSWVISITDALGQEGGLDGALHPNEKGHDFMAGVLVEAIRGELDNAAPSDVVAERRPSGRLNQRAAAGDTRLDVDSEGFAPGDQVIVDLGADVEEHGTVERLGSIILTEPLTYDHPAGAMVVKVGEGQLSHDDDDGDGGEPNPPEPGAPGAEAPADLPTTGSPESAPPDDDGSPPVARPTPSPEPSWTPAVTSPDAEHHDDDPESSAQTATADDSESAAASSEADPDGGRGPSGWYVAGPLLLVGALVVAGVTARARSGAA